MFPRSARIFGVDLSEPMLRQALCRVARERLVQVQGLALMDATRLAFPDASFACSLLMYVLPATPQPIAILNEAARVVRPGGEIIITSRITSKAEPLAAVDSWLGRNFASQLGWNPYFPWAVIGDWLESQQDLQLIERRRIAPPGFVSLIRIQRLWPAN